MSTPSLDLDGVFHACHFVDTQDDQVAGIVKKVLTLHHTLLVKQDGEAVGRISKRRFRIFGDRFKVALRDDRRLRESGNLWDREFDIADHGTPWHTSRAAGSASATPMPWT